MQDKAQNTDTIHSVVHLHKVVVRRVSSVGKYILKMGKQYAALRELYETTKTIGTGGFAKVKLATHLQTGEKVAIKIMDKEQLGEDLPRVKMELEALKSLSHQHICKLYQVIETETHYFLVMEYCAGGELFDHIVQCNRLSEVESRSFFRQILSAVAYLHSKGYVHRDIKPENVLLDKDQNVKLIDFGLCARPSPGIDCHLNTACGSPTYAAPELIRGDKYLGSAVDVWSLGVVLYALLCGSLPFDSEKIDVLYKQILSGSYATPPYLSKGSQQVLRAMLETDPSKRITVEDLLSHPWVQLLYDEPVAVQSLHMDMELDNNCVNTLAAHYGLSAEHIWLHLNGNNFDSMAATYQLLLSRKKQGLPIQLGKQRQQCVRQIESRGNHGTFVKLPSRPTKSEQDEKENEANTMQPPESSPMRVLRKRTLDVPTSPVPKKIAKQSESGSRVEANQNSSSVPCTPTKSTSSPSSRLLNSIERKFQRVRNVLTPKRNALNEQHNTPTLLSVKNMCNISTTSSDKPEHVKEELLKALNSQGIECKCKGYLVQGKLQAQGGRICKLSFELEVCLIPTSANASGLVVGIRRKRLKGDAWCYKRVCEEVLKMANL